MAKKASKKKTTRRKPPPVYERIAVPETAGILDNIRQIQDLLEDAGEMRPLVWQVVDQAVRRRLRQLERRAEQ